MILNDSGSSLELSPCIPPRGKIRNGGNSLNKRSVYSVTDLSPACKTPANSVRVPAGGLLKAVGPGPRLTRVPVASRRKCFVQEIYGEYLLDEATTTKRRNG